MAALMPPLFLPPFHQITVAKIQQVTRSPAVYREITKTSDDRRIQKMQWCSPALSGVRCADMFCLVGQQLRCLLQFLFLFLVLYSDSWGRLGNPHSPLLIQLNNSGGSNLGARQHQRSQELVFCSNLVLIVRQVLQEPPGFSRPGPVRVEGLLNVLVSLISLQVSSGQQQQRLSCSVTSRSERRSQEPSEPITPHNLWPGDFWPNDTEPRD